MPNTQKALLFSLMMGLLAIFVAITPQTISLEENLGLYLLFQLRGPQPAPADVVVVALDRKSSKEMNLPMEPRKWPRSVHAALIDRLVEAGAAVIAFDLIFNEPQTPETDQALADAIRRAGNVILAQSIVDDTMTVVDAKGSPNANVSIEKMIPPIPLLADAAMALAPFPVPKVPIKLSRFWTFKPGAGDVPTMPVMTFHAYAWKAFVQLSVMPAAADPAAKISLIARGDEKLRGDRWIDAIQTVRSYYARGKGSASLLHTLPDRYPEPMATWMRSLIRLYTNGTSRYLNFYGPAKTIRTIPYYRLMASRAANLKDLNLAGRAVFVGQTESYWPKAKDGFYTVYANENAVDISGVEIAATAFANLGEDRSVEPLGMPIHLGIVFLWGAMVAVISYRWPTAISAAGIVGLAGLYLIFACAQFNASGTWYPLVVPIFLLSPLAYFSALIWKYRIVSRERKTIRKAFGYYLPDPVVDQLSRNIQSIQSERKAVYSICMFTDAEKYTNLSETMDPENLTIYMNQYYEAIFKPIRDNGGVVLQVIGDSVLSLWTSLHPDPALKHRACTAALGVADAVDRFNRRATGQPLPTRIGLHAGEVVLGNIGALDHFEYRPVGDIVNTASRLEGLNKYLQTRILVSKALLDPSQSFPTRYVGRFLFVGKSKPVDAYELSIPAEVSGKDRRMSTYFTRGMQAFQQQTWDDAYNAFEQALSIQKEDGPSKFYLEMCNDFRRTPPDPDWDGTVHLKRK